MSSYSQRKQEAKDRIQQIQLQIEEVQLAITEAQQEYEESILTRSQQRQAAKEIENYQEEHRRLVIQKDQAERHLAQIREENREQRRRRRRRRDIQQAHPQSSVISSEESE